MTPRGGTWRLSGLLWMSAAWVLLTLLWCVPALAHANLVKSSPSAGSELSAAPEQVRLRFNEPVDAEFSPIEVRNKDGERVDKDDARVAPEDVRVVVANLVELPEGYYRVEWRVTSLDGHVIEGRYGFAIIAAGEGNSPGDEPGERAQQDEANAGQAGREPGTQDGTQGDSVPLMAYSALSLGALAVVVVVALLVKRLTRRHKR